MSVRVLVGDCRTVLTGLPDASVQCVVTSPPYWGLRDYGTATWEGGMEGCDHRESNPARTANAKATSGLQGSKETCHSSLVYRGDCGRCGATRVDAQLGLEKTPEEYVARMVEVFREVRRVLRDDGVCWINIGDSYASEGGAHGGRSDNQRGVGAKRAHEAGAGDQSLRRPPNGIKAKDLVGIPWMVAFALRADGWYLRSEIIWHKPNPMPESVTDRPTKAHEQIFLLSKSARYFYDAAAIAEPGVEPDRQRADRIGGANGHTVRHSPGAIVGASATRNKRSVWTVPTTPFPGSHFAVFPPDLIEPCILAGSAKQACEHCGAAWVRSTEVVDRVRQQNGTTGVKKHADARNGGSHGDAGLRSGFTNIRETTGFAPGCDCADNTGTARSVVLDPFGGAGTTGLVADRLGRDAILVELNPEYAAMARERVTNDCPLFTDVA